MNEQKYENFWKKYHLENKDIYNFFFTELKKVVDKLDVNSVLEIGCGLGNKLTLFNCDKRIGIDLSEYAIKSAKENQSNIKFLLANAISIPLNETFDLVYTVTTIEHIKPILLYRAFDEMFRLSNKYILNIEAFDTTEHEIDWHRGRNKFWTINMKERWKKYTVKILLDYDIGNGYRLTLVTKTNGLERF